MSDGNRSGVDKAALKRWIYRALFGAAILVAVAGIQHGIYYNEAANRAADHASNAENQITSKCLVASSRPECSREIKDAARSEQRDEYDLYSQKAMALWTAVMGIVGVFGLGLSGVGVLLIWRTWEETQKGVQAANDTVAETAKATEAVARQTRIAEQAQRPWIDIECDPIWFEINEHGPSFRFCARFRNIGKTIAHGVRFYAHPLFLINPRQKIIEWFGEQRPVQNFHGNTLLPDEWRSQSSVIRTHFDRVDEQETDGKTHNYYAVVCAAVFYKIDPEGDYCQTMRSFVIDVGGGQLVPRDLARGTYTEGLTSHKYIGGKTT